MSNPRLQAHPLRATSAALRSGEIPLLDYVSGVCDYIERVEPEVRALLPEPGRRARLLREAAALAERYPEPDDADLLRAEGDAHRNGAPARRPPLYGVLVGVKDIIRVDGFPTRCGSMLPPELFAGPEASSVTRLKRAGALILGKTVTTEFAYFEPGPTGNPWNIAHTPGGSSSGSAAAVAAGYCALALGSQTIGSVIRPGAFCGVAGYKPSYGLLPLDGVIPYAPALDHLGLFVQDPRDIELAMSVLSPGFRCATTGSALAMVPEGPFLQQAAPEALAAFEAQVAALCAGGIPCERRPAPASGQAVNRTVDELAALELAQTHAEWFSRYPELYRPRTRAWVQHGQALSAREAEIRQAAAGLAAVIRASLPEGPSDRPDRQLRTWICPPATGPAPEGLQSTGNPCMNAPWTLAGMPAVTLPAGYAENGLPLGLQCVSAPGTDEALIAFARETGARLKGIRYTWS